MSSLTKLFILPLFLIFFLSGVTLTLASEPYLTILVYHRFGETKYPTTSISEERFREQMEYLREENYQVLSLEKVRQFYQKKQDFPNKAVLITIDDAYRSVYKVAYPILKNFDYPFTVFLYSESIERGYSAMMTLEMIQEMKQAGVTFGNHTHTHPHLSIPAVGTSEEEYRLWVREEIRTCQSFLHRYGIESYSIAFPYGEYNSIILEEAENLGYNLMFSQNAGSAIIPLDQQMVLPRQAIAGENMSLNLFKQRLACPPLIISFSQPPSGFLKSAKPEEFSVCLVHPEKYRPGIINMFVSELGRLQADFNPETGWVRSTNQKKLTRAVNRVTVTAKEKNSSHFALTSWLICLPPPWEVIPEN